MIRQQIGQFLYVVDRVASEVVVFNSNRFTVLDRIRLLDPTSLAMSPNLDFLAVTNEGADLVSFIDVDPSSATFHQIIKTTHVGTGPTGIAWESANEDIFVCNQGEGTVSVISGFTLNVRKTLRNQLSRPIDVSLTPRQSVFGFARGVYFGYILNQNGTVAVFESGPDGINGFGFDDVIVSLPFRFQRPKTLQVDPTNLNSAVWIVHESPLDPATGNAIPGKNGGAVSNVGITGGLPASSDRPRTLRQPAAPRAPVQRHRFLRRRRARARRHPGRPRLDNMRNLSALTNYATTFSPAAAQLQRQEHGQILNGVAVQVNAPQLMFVAVPNPGEVDVFDMTSGSFERVDTNPFVPGFQPISVPNVTVVADYFRQ